MSTPADIANIGGGVKNLAIGVGILAALGAAVWIGRKFWGVREKINPLSDKNIIYQGVNDIARELTGNQESDATVGTLIFDGVDRLKDFLPWFESEAERNQRLQAEAMAQRRPFEPVDFT